MVVNEILENVSLNLLFNDFMLCRLSLDYESRPAVSVTVTEFLYDLGLVIYFPASASTFCNMSTTVIAIFGVGICGLIKKMPRDPQRPARW